MVLQGEAAADAESKTQALKVMRGAMSLLTMVAAVLPDAAAEQLEVILQVLAISFLLNSMCLKRDTLHMTVTVPGFALLCASSIY